MSRYVVQVLGEETREKETEWFEHYEERMVWTHEGGEEQPGMSNLQGHMRPC